LTSLLGMWDMFCSHHTYQHTARLAMKPLAYATEKRSMSTSFNSCNTRALRPSQRISLSWCVDGFGQEALDSLRKECRVSRSSVSITHTVCITQSWIHKANNDTSLQGIYKLSHSWVIVWTTLKWIMPNVFSSRSWFRLQVLR
jgi:hypothetical protein